MLWSVRKLVTSQVVTAADTRGFNQPNQLGVHPSSRSAQHLQVPGLFACRCQILPTSLTKSVCLSEFPSRPSKLPEIHSSTQVYISNDFDLVGLQEPNLHGWSINDTRTADERQTLESKVHCYWIQFEIQLSEMIIKQNGGKTQLRTWRLRATQQSHEEAAHFALRER